MALAPKSPPSDAQAHFDLGVAYMAMGLHEDAIAELTMAARDPRRAATCLGMIVMLHRTRGDQGPPRPPS